MRDRQNVVAGLAATAAADAATPPSPPRDVHDLPTAEQVDTAVATLAMLADRTRLQLLWLLSRGEHDVGTLADLTDTTPGAASQHLAKLRLAGLVSVRQDGRKRIYAARGSHLRQLISEALFHADHRVGGTPDHD